MPSEVIRGHQRSSEAIRGHPSEAIIDALRWQSTSLVPLPFEDAPDEGCNQMQSDVISGT
jgi:hypothetical protein